MMMSIKMFLKVSVQHALNIRNEESLALLANQMIGSQSGFKFVRQDFSIIKNTKFKL